MKAPSEIKGAALYLGLLGAVYSFMAYCVYTRVSEELGFWTAVLGVVIVYLAGRFLDAECGE